MNEPVAWMVDGVLFTSLGAALNISFDIEQPCIPLYTHPAKELTDEEIVNVFHEYQGEDRRPFVNFARAILRKAQEK
jgi:rubrerythrin